MTKEEILEKANFDINKAKAMYEWLNSGETAKESTTTNQEAIIEVYHYGKFDGVRVQTLGEDFIIGLHDLDDGKSNFSYNDAMSSLKEHNMTTFNRKQSLLVCFYLDEINDKLKEAGGEAFSDDWYTTNELYIPKEKRSSADYYPSNCWCFNGAKGCIYYYTQRCEPYFHCRPVMNLHFKNYII